MTTRFAALLLIVAGLFGCRTSPGPGGVGHAEALPPAPPPLAGSNLFYDGNVECRIDVSFSRLHPRGSGGAGGGGRTGRVTGNVQGNGGGIGSKHWTGEEEDSDPPPLSLAAMGPPAALYLRFTNLGKSRIELEVLDFASQFGNFAVQPEKIALEPGQWVEAEPMSSQILNTSGDVTVKVSLRSAGRKETETVALHPTAR